MDTIFLPIKPGKQYTKLVVGTATYYGMADVGTALDSPRWSLAKVVTGVSYLGGTQETTMLPIGDHGQPTSKEQFKFSEVLNLNFSFTPDAVAPTLSTVTIASDGGDPTQATVGDVVTITIVSSEALGSIEATIGGIAATIVQTDSKHFTASREMTEDDTEGTVAFAINFTDVAGLSGTQVTAVTSGSGVTFSLVSGTAPTISAQPSDYSQNDGETSASKSVTVADTEGGQITVYVATDDDTVIDSVTGITIATSTSDTYDFGWGAIACRKLVMASPGSFSFTTTTQVASSGLVGLYIVAVDSTALASTPAVVNISVV